MGVGVVVYNTTAVHLHYNTSFAEIGTPERLNLFQDIEINHQSVTVDFNFPLHMLLIFCRGIRCTSAIARN